MLFAPETETVKGAHFSDDRAYRYALWRTWDEAAGFVMFIGLNPSTADERADDPTIRRCIGFAKAWGYGGIAMLNLFAFRATDPKVMLAASDPVGPENDEWLMNYYETAGMTIAAWGAHGAYRGRDRAVCELRRRDPNAKTDTLGECLYCLGRTKHGQPRHPLYLPKDMKPQRFVIAD